MRTFADYASRMVDLLKALSVAEDWGQNAVYSDILTVNTDVIRVALKSFQFQVSTRSGSGNAVRARGDVALVLGIDPDGIGCSESGH